MGSNIGKKNKEEKLYACMNENISNNMVWAIGHPCRHEAGPPLSTYAGRRTMRHKVYIASLMRRTTLLSA